MKRFWFGAILLAVLLAAGLGSGVWTEKLHQPVIRLLEQASGQEDWALARQYQQQAQALWEKHWPLCASIADHEPMEQIDSLFAQTQVHLQFRDQKMFRATVDQICQQLEDLIEEQSPAWWNLL